MRLPASFSAATRPPAEVPPAQAMRAIGLCLVAHALIALSDVAVKLALQHHGVGEVLFARGGLGGLMLGGPMIARNGLAVLLPRRPGLVFARSAIHCAGSVFWYYAFAVLPLADVYAIGYATPLVVSLMAIPLLGERVGWRLWAATLVGFAGVLVMVRPGGDFWQPATLAILAGIVLVALARVMARQLALIERVDVIVIWLILAHIPMGAAVMLAIGAVAPTPASFAALVAMAALNSAGHLLMTRAYALSPISALGPYEYTTFLWALGFGVMMFHETPGVSTLVGAVIVIVAGLFDLRRARVTRAGG
ncbi:MAG: DMT family transporter [Acetobacteraceae bacterium]|nr:DMT family transporter [Acetobacteraceae bacterium]